MFWKAQVSLYNGVGSQRFFDSAVVRTRFLFLEHRKKVGRMRGPFLGLRASYNLYHALSEPGMLHTLMPHWYTLSSNNGAPWGPQRPTQAPMKGCRNRENGVVHAFKKSWHRQ